MHTIDGGQIVMSRDRTIGEAEEKATADAVELQRSVEEMRGKLNLRISVLEHSLEANDDKLKATNKRKTTRAKADTKATADAVELRTEIGKMRAEHIMAIRVLRKDLEAAYGKLKVAKAEKRKAAAIEPVAGRAHPRPKNTKTAKVKTRVKAV